MARLVYIAHGLRGSLYTSLALLKRLRADGHEITVMTFRDVADDVNAAGFDFVHLSDTAEAQARFRKAVAGRGKLRAMVEGRRLRSQLVRSTETRDRVGELAPDLLIIDAEMHTAILSTRELNIPTVLAVPWFSPFRAPGLPPMHTDLRPSTSLLGRLRIEMAWEWQRAYCWHRRRVGLLTVPALRQQFMPFELSTPNIQNVRAVARFHNVDLEEISSWSHWMSPVVYPDIPIMTYTASEMEFPHRAPDVVTSVGPIIDERRAEPMVSAHARARWEAFRDDMTAAARPIVYISMGSMIGEPEFYKRVCSVFAQHSEWAAVFGLGSQGNPEDFSDAPTNVLALDYAPQLDVLRSASVAIHHGGIGTTHECIAFEVPMIVACAGFVDEPGNAARVDHFGLGITIDPEDLNERSMADAIARMLVDSTVAVNLARMSTSFDRYVEKRIPEDLIAKLLAQA